MSSKISKEDLKKLCEYTECLRSVTTTFMSQPDIADKMGVSNYRSLKAITAETVILLKKVGDILEEK